MKRLMSTLMILSLLLSQAIVVGAANSAKACTLRLESTKGTVSLMNESKKSLTCRDGMKLLSGYSLSTNAASYAYVSLDENKAVKLDGLSTATIKQKGKKLELLLSSGKLFFDVKVPLKQDETMEIRTSTMVTGIRGTAGMVEIKSPTETILMLLTGHVRTVSADPTTGQMTPVDIYAGQRATFIRHGSNFNPEVRLSQIQPSDIPAFVLQEISNNPSLLEQFRKQTKFDPNTILLDVAKLLHREESTQLERERLSKQAMDAQSLPNLVSNLFSPAKSSDHSRDSASPPPTSPSSTVLSNVTDVSQITDAFHNFDIVKLGSNFALNAPLAVPAGKTLQVLTSATLTTNGNNTLTVDGTVIVDSGATLINNAEDSNGASGIVVNSAHSMIISGTLENNKQIKIGERSQGAIKIGTLVVSTGGTLTNNGSLTIVSGSLKNQGNITSSGTIFNQDILENSGTLATISSGQLQIDDSDVPQRPGKTTNTATGKISLGGNYAVLSINMHFENDGIIENNGNISYTGGFFLSKNEIPGAPSVSLSYQDAATSGIVYGNTLSNIFENARSGATLTLTKPLVISDSDDNPNLAPNKTLTLDTGPHILTLDKSHILNKGNLTLTSTAPSAGGTITGASENPMLQNEEAGTIKINNNITISNSKGSVLSASGGTIELKDTAILQTTSDSYPAILLTGGNMSMTGGAVFAQSRAIQIENACIFTMNGADALVETQSESSNNCAIENQVADNFVFTHGTVRAKGSNAIYKYKPTDAPEPPQTPSGTGFFQVNKP